MLSTGLPEDQNRRSAPLLSDSVRLLRELRLKQPMKSNFACYFTSAIKKMHLEKYIFKYMVTKIVSFL